MTYKLLYKGFDKFDVAFRGALPIPVLNMLEAAKNEAVVTKQDSVLVTIKPGNVSMLVSSSGMRGGYAYSCSTGPTGANWFFKKSASRAEWNIFVSVQSRALLCEPLETIFADIKNALTRMGAVFDLESINRIDYAMDFFVPNFVLNHENFVAQQRTKIRPHWSEKIEDENQPRGVFAGRRCESVTVGKMPNRQIIVYDKLREVVDQRKSHWFKVWRVDPADKKQSIWRIEVRAGKRHLADTWKLRSYADIEASIGDVFKAAMEDVRYLSDCQTDSNVTRQLLHPLWADASRHVFYALTDHQSGLTKDQVISIERDDRTAMYYSQIQGLLAGYVAVSNEFIDGDYDDLPSRLTAQLHSIVSNDESAFYQAVTKAKRRFHFL